MVPSKAHSGQKGIGEDCELLLENQLVLTGDKSLIMAYASTQQQARYRRRRRPSSSTTASRSTFRIRFSMSDSFVAIAIQFVNHEYDHHGFRLIAIATRAYRKLRTTSSLTDSTSTYSRWQPACAKRYRYLDDIIRFDRHADGRSS